VRPSQLSLLHRLRSNLLLAPPFLLATAFFGTLALAVSTWDKSGRLQQSVARVWARSCVFFSGSRLQVLGLENIPAALLSDQDAIDSARGHRRHAQCVFAANHTSYMDTPVVFASLPFQFRILAKTELWRFPFIGWYLGRSGQIPIDTANPRATLSSLGKGVAALRSGLSVFVFPEGGRTPTGALQPFLNGAAYLALRAQVPLVPIALVGVYDLLPIHTGHFYPSRTPLKLIFGTPIPTHGRHLREAEALTEELRQSIATLVAQHSSPN
jgi:1-acyl-sn-glycerol-3-phosphate acyltransferase